MKTLISASDLKAALTRAHPLVLLDCGFDLADPSAGHRAWQASHLPEARYAHLDDDLAGPRRDTAGVFRGRHPLPDRASFARKLGEWGIGPDTAVVCYDAQGGPYAARAWWLLRWMGHEDVAVLDGGPAAWRAAGGEMTGIAPHVAAREPYPARAPSMPTIDADALRATLGRVRLVDARAGERFRGEIEPLDRVPGHIPGAHHRFFKDNLGADGRFKGAAQLRAEWVPIVASEGNIVHSCGSGVTACHNLLAMAHAGLGTGSLYPGSWSEWSDDPARPVARG